MKSEFHLTAVALRASVVAGIILMTAGLVSGWHAVLYAGALILTCAPAIGMAAAYGTLIRKKDWKWVKIAAVLAVVMIIGIITTILK